MRTPVGEHRHQGAQGPMHLLCGMGAALVLQVLHQPTAATGGVAVRTVRSAAAGIRWGLGRSPEEVGTHDAEAEAGTGVAVAEADWIDGVVCRCQTVMVGDSRRRPSSRLADPAAVAGAAEDNPRD